MGYHSIGLPMQRVTIVMGYQFNGLPKKWVTKVTGYLSKGLPTLTGYQQKQFDWSLYRSERWSRCTIISHAEIWKADQNKRWDGLRVKWFCRWFCTWFGTWFMECMFGDGNNIEGISNSKLAHNTIRKIWENFFSKNVYLWHVSWQDL